MKFSYDPDKRAVTLARRGLDFADAPRLFAGPQATLLDDRQDYGEARYQTYGRIDGRLMLVVWTAREDGDGGEVRHIMSMRKCNDREQARFGPRLG